MTLTDEQRDDLATLLARAMNRANLASLAVSVLGPAALADARNDLENVNAVARYFVTALDEAGRVPEAVARLREDLHRDAWVTVRLNHILSGGRLGDDEALQRFMNDYEPFLDATGIHDLLPQMYRTICAIALGDPHDEIVGSGFLIGPDLVMTNHHVVEAFVEERDGRLAAKPTTTVYCFFDYYMAPAPDVPPGEAKQYGSKCVRTVANDWVVHGRKLLPFDGTDQAPLDIQKCYDYVVMRLEKPIGRMPSRIGSTDMRGWLPLPDSIEAIPAQQKRILVFQHPQKAPQKWDIGNYDSLDPSRTRVRYRVSAAHGSSGGAAVDTSGKLYALHNAEVRSTNGERLNQGVRIDHITRDLVEAAPGLAVELRNAQAVVQSSDFWSMSDDPVNPQPVIGRRRFRENVRAMTAAEGARRIVVTGPRGSGVRFSIELLRRTLGTNIPVIEFSANDIQRLDPATFVKFVVSEIVTAGSGGPPMPTAPATEQVSRWLRLDLPRWLLDHLATDEAQNRNRYPAWIVMNTIDPSGNRVLWADNLKDCVAALAGVHDQGQPLTDIPHLRWLFLAHAPEALPVRGGAPQDEDLGRYDSGPADFAEAVAMGWALVEKGDIIPPPILMGIARYHLRQAENRGTPIRQALSDLARGMLIEARSAGATQ